MSLYKKDELKEYAKVIMINPSSNKSRTLISTLCQLTGLPYITVLERIQKIAEG